MPRVTVMSDLHLEFAGLSGLPGGDILILAGDIWTVRHMRSNRQDADSRGLRKRFEKFCREELSKYLHVLIITGNHEGYGEVYEELHDVLGHFLALHASHATLLNNEVAKIGGVAFLGTPLWSSCGVGNPVAEQIIRRTMNDFHLIRTNSPVLEGDWALRPANGKPRIFTPADANMLHRNAVAWLREELPRHDCCVVIGHHAPSLRSSGGGHTGDNDLDLAYCGQLDGLILDHPQIKVWIHGHTHRDERYSIGGTRVIANPRGYFPDERCARAFNPAAADFDLDEVGASPPLASECNLPGRDCL